MIRATVAILGLWVLAAAALFGTLAFEKHRINVLQKQKEELTKPAGEVARMKNRVMLVQRYTDRSKSALECLRHISSLLPEGIDLSSFSYRKGEGVKISGDATTVNLVYDFKKQIDDSGFFLGSTLDGPKLDSHKNRQSFDLDMKLAGGGATP